MVDHELKRPYLLLDAGGTLVSPNAEIIRQSAKSHGLSLDVDAVLDAFFRNIHGLDLSLRQGGVAPPLHPFLGSLMAPAGTPPSLVPAVLTEAERLCRRQDGGSWIRTFWTYALPWTRPALERLRAAGYRMSVVSNSDGSVAHQVADLGLARYLDVVFDSQVLGVEKPDPRFFHLVLEQLGVGAADCLLVGDVFMIDVVGANAVGVPAAHIDPLGLYAGWPGVHTRDLRTFAEALITGELDPLDPRLLAMR